VLNRIQDQGVSAENLPVLLFYLSLLVAGDAVYWIFHGPARVIENKNSFLVKANYKQYLLEGTLNLPASWHTDHHSGDTIDKIEKSSSALFDYSGTTFIVIETIFSLVGSYLALIYFNIHSSYIVVFFLILTLAIVTKFDKTIMKNYDDLYKTENSIAAKVYDVISNVTTVIILRIEDIVTSSIFKKMMAPFRLFSRTHKLNETKWFLVSMSGSLMTFFVIATYIFFNYKAETVIYLGTMSALYGYVNRIQSLFYRFAYEYSRIVNRQTALQNADVIRVEFKEKQKECDVRLANWKEITVKNLNFSYHTDKEDLHLTDINLVLKRNQRIALVGASGGGKTTVLKVLRNLYQPKSGKVLIDDREEDMRCLSRHITLIPQDPEIFNDTIRENITCGIPHDIETIKKYTDIACFTEIALSLPHRWESTIMERGVNLSGGEKQRLALARGLLASADKQLVFLDEPTSSVDTKNELQIFKNIFNEFKDKTIVSSVHRLHLLHLFDQIYYFKNGRIIACGTLTQVMKNKEFAEIWKKYHRNGIKARG
jgi:ABC-type multidrug transport system fused ATPase/permease subunit